MTETKPYTILLIEDEAPAALVLSNALKQENFEVIIAKDGVEGLKLALEKHPDVIVTDLMLPGINGLDVIRHLHKDPWGKTAEVIILSNLSDVDTLDAAMSEGTFFYMVKGDSSMSDIIAKVKSRLKPRA